VKLEYELTIDGGAPFTARTPRWACANAANTGGITNVSYATQLTTGAWWFVVCTYDATNDLIGISVNGSALTTASHSGGAFDGAGNFGLGRSMGSVAYHYDGLIDEVGIWKRLLSATDITTLYNAGNGLAYTAFTT
jgi:hypothetical protein